MHFRRLRMEPLEDRRLLATFNVTNLSDGPVTAAGQLPGSLRQAIFDANATSVKDEIVFGTTTGTINLSAGEFVISNPVDILGPGREALTIDAHDASRIFTVNTGAASVAISDLTLKDGKAPTGPGGAVRFLSTGTLSIEDIKIESSRTVDASSSGGAVYSAGPLSIKNSTLEGNSVEGNNSYGGAIYAEVSVEVLGSTIQNNFSRGAGGGIRAEGIVTVKNSAIIGNHTNGNSASGGGIYGFQDITLVNSTISGNYTTGYNAAGGGIFALRNLQVVHSTVANNSTTTAYGGGIAIFATSGTRNFTLSHSIIAGNNSTLTRGKDVIGLSSGTVSLTSSFSLIGNTNGLTGTQLAHLAVGSGNQRDTNPFLGPLQNNGGSIPTHALLPGSPAINAGEPTSMSGVNGVPAFDQRGTGFARVSGGRIDMGAFEVQAPIASGDFDADGDVDGRDFLLWQRNPSVGSLANWQSQYGTAGVVATIEADLSTSAIEHAADSTWFLTSSYGDSEREGDLVIDEPQGITVVDDAFENWPLPVRSAPREFGDIANRRAGLRGVIPACAEWVAL